MKKYKCPITQNMYNLPNNQRNVNKIFSPTILDKIFCKLVWKNKYFHVPMMRF